MKSARLDPIDLLQAEIVDLLRRWAIEIHLFDRWKAHLDFWVGMSWGAAACRHLNLHRDESMDILREYYSWMCQQYKFVDIPLIYILCTVPFVEQLQKLGGLVTKHHYNCARDYRKTLICRTPPFETLKHLRFAELTPLPSLTKAAAEARKSNTAGSTPIMSCPHPWPTIALVPEIPFCTRSLRR